MTANGRTDLGGTNGIIPFGRVIRTVKGRPSKHPPLEAFVLITHHATVTLSIYAEVAVSLFSIMSLIIR